jgi:hypothetical protein
VRAGTPITPIPVSSTSQDSGIACISAFTLATGQRECDPAIERQLTMTVLRITRGLPASGKSILAMKWVAEDPANRARVNRDDLRAMLHDGVYLGRDTEVHVRAARDALLTALLGAGAALFIKGNWIRRPRLSTCEEIRHEHGPEQPSRPRCARVVKCLNTARMGGKCRPSAGIAADRGGVRGAHDRGAGALGSALRRSAGSPTGASYALSTVRREYATLLKWGHPVGSPPPGCSTTPRSNPAR